MNGKEISYFIQPMGWHCGIHEAMMENIRIGISSCLLGNNVRYDGGHQHDRYITDTLGRYFTWVPVCPEVECGLGIPREAMRLIGEPESPRLVTIRSGIDHTERMLQWKMRKCKELENEKLCGFIFKSKSPSSGIGGVKIYSSSGMPDRKGAGIFGGAFVKHFSLIPVIDDGRLHDPIMRENFIERVFVYKRWCDLIQEKGSVKELIHFHTRHKLLIMAHNPKHVTILGRMVADTKAHEAGKYLADYMTALTDALRLSATLKKNANVLFHMAGYFKKRVSEDERRELAEVIEDYRRGLIPLIVPIVMIRHYVRKFDEPYLKNQYYLNPHPLELMLRNHV
jgi:uncharacterized protein YbgA (DUF1722 family)/uncharacterized protein YbbK (DUF523 family)